MPDEPGQLVFAFAGGGSGGHISPGISIAEALQETPGTTVRSVFLCSDRPIDAHMLGQAGASYHALPARPPSRRPLVLLRFLRAWHVSRRQARSILQEESVTHLVALGGYVSVPAVQAASALRIRITLLNMDRPPGKANRFIARSADQVWSTCPLPENDTFAHRVVGHPVRRAAIACESTCACRTSLGLAPDIPVLLVTGASQGAESLNTFMQHLTAAHPDEFAHWQILHLAGHGSQDMLSDHYAKHGIRALVMPFLNEMGTAWGAAELSLSRAGASSVAEVAANAVPCLFLPYPYHTDMHQQFNALPLVEAGGSRMRRDHIAADRNLDDAGHLLLELLRDDSQRDAMRAALRAIHADSAAVKIAAMLLGRA